MVDLLGVILIGQAKVARDPMLHREWVTFAVEGGGKARLWLTPAGKFTEVFTEPSKSTPSTITGIYRKAKAPTLMPFMSKSTSYLELNSDLASAQRMGMPKSEVTKLKRSKQTTTPFQRLFFDPTIPVLTDPLFIHFAPAGDKEAIRRFSDRLRKLNRSGG